MSLFRVNKPRGFQHNYIYYDPRKEKLQKIEENAKRELGLLPEKEFDPEDIRGKFVGATSSGILIMIIILLILVMKYIYTGRVF